MPSLAIWRSTASSQAASWRGSSRRRLRWRSACSNAAARAAWPGSIARTRRSTKRRRSPAGPLKSPSSAGVIQTMRRCSLKALDEGTGAPLMRERRTGFCDPGSRSLPVARRVSASAPSRSATTAKLPVPPSRAMSESEARLIPLPGESSDSASSRLVLPTPFSPQSATSIGPKAQSSAAKLRKSLSLSRAMRGAITRSPLTAPLPARRAGRSHAHRHQHVERRGSLAFLHQGRRAGLGELEYGVVTVELAEHVEEIAGVEADIEGLRLIFGLELLGRAAGVGIGDRERHA